jgi:hypothetical protein
MNKSGWLSEDKAIRRLEDGFENEMINAATMAGF